MMEIIIVSLSVFFQLCAMIITLRLFPSSGKVNLSWIFISLSQVFMISWRVLTLVFVATSYPGYTFNLTIEVIAVLITLVTFLGAIGFGPLLTDRANTEKLIRQANQRLNDIIEFLPDATFVIDKDRKIIAWNRAVEKMTGVRKEDILRKKSYSEAFYGVRRPILIDIALEEVGKARELYPTINFSGNEVSGESYTPMVWYGNGAYCWGTASRLFDTDGKVVGAIESVRDITDRHNIEEKLKQAHQRLNDIIEFLPDATFVIDKDRKIIAWNRAMEKMSGMIKDDMMGKSDYSLCFFHESRPLLVDILLDPGLANPKNYSQLEISGHEAYGEAFAPKMNNGKGAFCWVIASKLFDLSGNVVGAIESVRDITERKQAEETMKKLNTQLEERVQKAISDLREKDQMMILQSRQAAMGEMLRNIAHQWRQPLNAIGIHVQNILEKDRAHLLESDYLEQNVKKAVGLILHMSQTIDDFRNFFKPEKTKIEFSLITALENALGFVSASFKNNGIETETVYEEELTVTGYPNELSQVILNILNNALDAIKERKPPSPKVRCRIFRDNGKSVIAVSDNAGGIPESVFPRIFEPYFTTKEMGTGIGLYMSKTIIEKSMGGKTDGKQPGRGRGVPYRIIELSLFTAVRSGIMCAGNDTARGGRTRDW